MTGAPSILVAEDNETNRLVAASLLSRLGCDHVMAVDGIEAVRAAMETRFSAIFMDCMMPRMDGYHATRAIRGHEQRSGSPRSPIIGLSALASPEDRSTALASGMDDYLTKPVSIADLSATLIRFGVPIRRTSGPILAARPVATGDPPILEPAAAAELRGLPDHMAELLWREFARDIGPRMEAISTAIATPDVAAVQRLVHSLRGNVATLGLAALAKALLACEVALKRGDPAWKDAWAPIPGLAERSRLAAIAAAGGQA